MLVIISKPLLSYDTFYSFVRKHLLFNNYFGVSLLLFKISSKPVTDTTGFFYRSTLTSAHTHTQEHQQDPVWTVRISARERVVRQSYCQQHRIQITCYFYSDLMRKNHLKVKTKSR